MKQIFALVALIGCAACSSGNVKETLGLNRHSPDEFRVLSRPPLSVPKEFYLYPPDEARKQAVVHPSRDAKTILFENATSEAPQSNAAETLLQPFGDTPYSSTDDSGFLNKLGAAEASDSIRETLSAEQDAAEAKKSGMLSTLRNQEQIDSVVDASKERERLIEAQKAGEAINEGDVPTVSGKKNTLDWLFD